MPVEAMPLQLVSDTANGVCCAASRLLKGSSVFEGARECASFADQAFYQHADGHARGKSVRVDDQIRPAATPSLLLS